MNKTTFKEVMQELGKLSKPIYFAVTMLQIIFFAVTIVFKTSIMVPASLLLCLLNIFFFLYTKDFAEYGDKPKQFNLTFFNTMLSLNVITMGLLSPVGKFFIIIGLVFCVVANITVFAVSTKDEFKQTKSKILMKDMYAKKKAPKRGVGDVTLGIDSRTGEPVVLPYSDRFLHMLILGPTGCGKTSQIIKPLVYQDMQNPDIGIIILEPKGDLADDAFGMAKYFKREDVTYFNPELSSCPYFNPLMGDETDVIENLVTTFKMLDNGSSTFFQDNNENLIRRAIKVLKRLHEPKGTDPTLIELDILINNTNGEGMKMVSEFSKLPCANDRIRQDNKSIAYWFTSDYFTGTTGERGATKTFENTSGVRNQIAKLISNPYLNKVLNPRSKEDLEKNGYLDFDRILADGGICCISSCQGKLRDLSRFLGFFLILQLQSSVFRRPGTPDTRRGCALYIDEFQVYANSGFSDMLTMGRSYRVASHLATQNRALIGMNSGKNAKGFLDLVSTNARNKIIFPGGNGEDAEYYSKEFGEDFIIKEEKRYSRPVATPFNIFDMKAGSETVGDKESWERRFRGTEIIYNKFKEAIYSIIQDNTLQRPGLMNVDFMPYEIEMFSRKFIADYKEQFAFESIDEITPMQTPARNADDLILYDDDDKAKFDDSVEAYDPFA